MQLFNWSQAYAVYIPEIDAEHRTLYKMADDLHRAIIAGVEPSQLVVSLRELLAHLADHFAHEERRMRSVDYPSFDQHKRQHDAARAKLRHFERRLRRGDREAALLLLHFLSDWMKEHLKLSDLLMGAYLRNYTRAHAMRAS